MSVALLIGSSDAEGAGQLVPIATESVFVQYWLPAATQLQLRWVPLLRRGIPITRSNIAPILDELGQLRAYFVVNNVPEVVSRIDGLAETLAHFEGCGDLDLWIG